MKSRKLTIDVFDHNTNRIVEMELKMVKEEKLEKGKKRVWLGKVENLPNGGEAELELIEYPEGVVNNIDKGSCINSPVEAIINQFLDN